MSKPPLLIVEDDPSLADRYRRAIPDRTALTAASRAEAMSIVARCSPAVAIVDLGLPPDPDGVSEGFATLQALLECSPDIKLVVAASRGGREDALRAIAAGAHDFFEKPVPPDVLGLIARRNLRLYDLEVENRRLAATPATAAMQRMVTAAPSMLRTCRDVEKLAQTAIPVLLQGERGTGKETLARALHELGPRSAKPFMAINCSAVPEMLLEGELFGCQAGGTDGTADRTAGRIEAADHGTLFIDEIENLPRGLLSRLADRLRGQAIVPMRARSPVPVGLRIVVATSHPAAPRTQPGCLDREILHRAGFVEVSVPPLRQRGGDPVLLARYFLNRFNREFGRDLKGFTPGALSALASHSWPENVRELQNRVKRAVILADARTISQADLGLAGSEREGLDLRAARLRAEREVIGRALSQSCGRIAPAARLLGISRPTLYGLLETQRMCGLREPGLWPTEFPTGEQVSAG